MINIVLKMITEKEDDEEVQKGVMTWSQENIKH